MRDNIKRGVDKLSWSWSSGSFSNQSYTCVKVLVHHCMCMHRSLRYIRTLVCAQASVFSYCMCIYFRWVWFMASMFVSFVSHYGSLGKNANELLPEVNCPWCRDCVIWFVHIVAFLSWQLAIPVICACKTAELWSRSFFPDEQRLLLFCISAMCLQNHSASLDQWYPLRMDHIIAM